MKNAKIASSSATSVKTSNLSYDKNFYCLSRLH
jgi:hypothetical protein